MGVIKICNIHRVRKKGAVIRRIKRKVRIRGIIIICNIHKAGKEIKMA